MIMTATATMQRESDTDSALSEKLQAHELDVVFAWMDRGAIKVFVNVAYD